ncbi:unnamed protein product [Darwinula stevensoni]|uniref:Cadherin domain-containing protein n=1 Tax=Darwinula stevensoni TaxID=69355 RepID=A0A7R8X9P6_9CRUS|nr:unnamed protein product [Darwinula stevensoni]CAG0889348.1 unnamed protein product [Darwinula stevensoni]
MPRCQIHVPGESAFFRKIPETFPVGGEVFQISASDRQLAELAPIGNNNDHGFFALVEIDSERMGVLLASPLDDVVDSLQRNGVMKFKFICHGPDTVEPVSLLLTVYVEDVNDNVPTFINTPYTAKVEELTPPGIAILNGIVAIDNDKSNTPNSDVIYTIVDGNERGMFQLKSSQSASLILNKPLDYDAGDREFNLRIRAKVKEF